MRRILSSRDLLASSAAALLLFVGCGDRRGSESPSLSSSAPSAITSASAVEAASAAAAPAPSGSADAPEVEKALTQSGQALVDLAGESHPAPPRADSGPRIAAKAMIVPVFERPNAESRRIGTLRAGAILPASPTDAGRAGCPGGWRKIEPVGYVCLGDKATTDLDDPIVRASTRRPDVSERLPYMYGTVTRGGPAYSRIPTEADLKELEPNLDKHIRKWKADEVSGASYGYELWFKWKPKPEGTAWEAWEDKTTDADIPWYLKDGGTVPNLSGLVKPGSAKLDQIDHKQGAAFIESFLWEGRRYNVTTDLRVVPADRYRPIRGSEHHGVRIGADVEIPFAIVRKKDAKKLVWSASKKKMTEDGGIEFFTAVNLTGKQKIVGGVLHYETKDGFWLDDRHASRIDDAKRMPKWGKNGERWIDVNITKQVLVAFEGEKPVYATLVSTGEDGLEEGKKSTKKGIFRIHTKYVTMTMDSDVVGEEFELRDVPYVQYFEEGFALHGAYWHDNFGTPKSHGCVNLTPEDARRLFFWTEPLVPPDWHGAAKSLTGTVVFVHP
jgi:hypothetical protein